MLKLDFLVYFDTISTNKRETLNNRRVAMDIAAFVARLDGLHVVNATGHLCSTGLSIQDNPISLETTALQAEYLCHNQVNRLYPGAYSAGFPYLLWFERIALLQKTREAIKDEGLVVCPVGSVHNEDLWVFPQQAKIAGADGFLVMPLRPDEAKDQRFMRYMQEAVLPTGLPVIIYLKKGMTPSQECVLELMQEPLIVAVKCGYKDRQQVVEVKQAIGDHAKLLVAVGERANPALVGLADGVFSGGANIYPQLARLQAWAVIRGYPRLAQVIADRVSAIDQLRTHDSYLNLDVQSVALSRIHNCDFGRPRIPEEFKLQPDEQRLLDQALDVVLETEAKLCHVIRCLKLPDHRLSADENGLWQGLLGPVLGDNLFDDQIPTEGE